MPRDGAKDRSRARVKHAVEEKIAGVHSPEQAEEVLRDLKAIPPQRKAVEAAEAVEGEPAAASVEHAGQVSAGRAEQAAAVLATSAAQAGTERPDAEAAAEGVQQALGTVPGEVPPEVEQGRELLREATLKELSAPESLDARVFLLINNGLPRPGWARKAADVVSVVANGGWIWSLAVLLDDGFRFGKRERRLLRVLLPTLGALNWVVEVPVKRYFRRQRPFIDVVRALVIGKKPGSWSFPSGHTASSFGAAWVLSTIWPRRAPAFFGLASFVGFTRVYVGVHYPGDVISGAVAGMFLGEIFRRLSKRLFL